MNEFAERCQAYETVAQSIRFIRLNSREQPGLDEIAAPNAPSARRWHKIALRCSFPATA